MPEDHGQENHDFQERVRRPRTRHNGGNGSTADAARAFAEGNLRFHRAKRRTSYTVKELFVGAMDSRGQKIERIYTKRDDLYAIYKVAGERQVYVQFADDPLLEEHQRHAIAQLSSMRAKLNHLMTKTPNTEYYDAEATNALQHALEARIATARALMAHTVDVAERERACAGRMQYVLFAGLVSVIIIGLLVLTPRLVPVTAMLHEVGLAALGGTIGAFLSICIAIRSRAVALDIYRTANITDGVLRVLIGGLAAGGLLLLTISGLLPKISVGDITLNAHGLQEETILVIGFVAGFLERLFPNLLEGHAGKSSDAPARRAGDPVKDGAR